MQWDPSARADTSIWGLSFIQAYEYFEYSQLNAQETQTQLL
jgi:hypothetical protein